LAHETLKTPLAVWGDWQITKSKEGLSTEQTQIQYLPDGFFAYRVKRPPIITKKEVLVASGGYNRYITLEVVDGVIPDLLIKGSDW